MCARAPRSFTLMAARIVEVRLKKGQWFSRAKSWGIAADVRPYRRGLA